MLSVTAFQGISSKEADMNPLFTLLLVMAAAGSPTEVPATVAGSGQARASIVSSIGLCGSASSVEVVAAFGDPLPDASMADMPRESNGGAAVEPVRWSGLAASRGVAVLVDALPGQDGQVTECDVSRTISVVHPGSGARQAARPCSDEPLRSGPALCSPEPHHDAGLVAQRSLLVHEFTFMNDGSAPLHVVAVPGCGAIVTHCTNRVEPGEHGVVGLKISTARLGDAIESGVALHSDSQDEPVVWLGLAARVE